MIDDRVIELQALITEREAMLALNIERENHGYSLAYGEEAFQELADKIRALKNAGGENG